MVVCTRRQAARANGDTSQGPSSMKNPPAETARNQGQSALAVSLGENSVSTHERPATASRVRSGSPCSIKPRVETGDSCKTPAAAACGLLPHVSTILLYEFDLPLELDLPYGHGISAFNPATYGDIEEKLRQWFPDLVNHDENQAEQPSRAGSQPSSQGPRGTQDPDKPKKRKGKVQLPDCVHLEVEIHPQVVTEDLLGLPWTSKGRTWSAYSPVPHQAFAVVALAPLDFKPSSSKPKEMAVQDENGTGQDGSSEAEEETDTLLLGYIVPSAFKDKTHPLAHLDPSLVTKEWIQLYGEVTLAPPFLPPSPEASEPHGVEQDHRKHAAAKTSTSAAPFTVKNEPDLEARECPDDTTSTKFLPPSSTKSAPTTHLFGVLNVQVGLEPVALQYGAGDAVVDGFVGSHDDLKHTGVEGSLTLARLLRLAIPAIVDWKHSFIEIDMDAYTYWDRNESFYDQPPKQSTLARHLVLDKVDPVDLPSAARPASKKRKKPSRSNPPSRQAPGPTYYPAPVCEEGPFCSCSINQTPPPPPKVTAPKVTAPSLGKTIKAADPSLGDPSRQQYLPLDTNVASLLEACRPPPDGPKFYPPTDMIPTPLLGYQARCLAWMIKRETIVDEDVNQLMPNWIPLRCKPADKILQRRLELEAERAALVDALQRGISRPRRITNVKTAQAEAARTFATAKADGQVSITLKREPFIDPVSVPFYFDQVSGMLSLRRFTCRGNEPGGALCESMGLGKTLESLALIASHPRPEGQELLSYDTSRSARMIAEMDSSERPFISRATLVVCPAALVEQWMDEIRKHFRSRTHPEYSVSGLTDTEAREIPDQQPGVVRYKHVDFAWDAESSRDEVRELAKERLTQPDIVVATYEELAFQLSESHRVQRTRNQVRTPLLEVLFWRILLDEAQIVAGASSKATEMVHELWRSNCWMVTGTPVTKGIRDIQGIFAFLDHDPFAAPRFFREVLQEPFIQGTVEGIRRLRSILPRFVWRHTQAHVEEEMVLPPCKSEILEIDLKHIERLFYDKEVSKYRETFAKRAGQGVATVPQPTFLINLRQLLSHPQIADQLMFSHNYSRLSFSELFRQFCLQAQAELDNIRMQLIIGTLQLVWGHDFYDAETNKQRWRGGRKALKDSEDVRKMLNEALRVAETALHDQSFVRTHLVDEERIFDADAQGAAPEGKDDLPATAPEPEQSANVDPKPADAEPGHVVPRNVEPSKVEPEPQSQTTRFDDKAWAGSEATTRMNLSWEEARYWLQKLLSQHAESTSVNAADRNANELEPPARWDPERPTRTFFEKEFLNANHKQVDLQDPRFHLVVQDAGAEDMDEAELMAQIEAERRANGQAGSSRKKQRKEAAFEPGLLKKSRLRGNATQRKQARVWFYKPKERLETTHARLLALQQDLPSKEHEVAFLRQKLVEVLSKSPSDSNAVEGTGMSMDSAAECQICYEMKEQIGVLPCYHSFCIDCIETLCKSNLSGPENRWRDRRGPRCPSCRLHFHPDRVTRIMERGRSASVDSDDGIVGDWSGKISGLILDLQARLGADPSHKAVIFSHWPKMLAFVRDALVQNQIPAVVFGGNEATRAEALRAIRDDHDVKAILVPFRASAGAAGLTLTSCDLAYLLEPALDAALEAQAIGRIHRIGQRRETTVFRVKMKDTIEDAVMRIAEQRSQRGMALATHADPGTAAEKLQSAASASSAAGPSNGQDTSVPIKTEEPHSLSTMSLPPNMRERSIKASVAASVGTARESDQTSLTMAEVGLILGFDVAEEKRKANEHRESVLQRAFRGEFSRPAWAERLTHTELEELEAELELDDEVFDHGGFSDEDDGTMDEGLGWWLDGGPEAMY